MAKIFDDLSQWIDMRYETEVTDVIIENDKVCGIKIKEETVFGNQVFLAVGREGYTWLQ